MIFLTKFLLVVLICWVNSSGTTFDESIINALSQDDSSEQMEEESLIKASIKRASCTKSEDCGPKESCGWFTKECYRSSCFNSKDCFSDEYCLRGKGSGYCEKKGSIGEWCMQDNRCLSMHCHNFKCKGHQKGKNDEPNGRCNDSEDCRFEQYCNNKKCVDRIITGSCSNDDQCLSNHCSFWNKCYNAMLKKSPSN